MRSRLALIGLVTVSLTACAPDGRFAPAPDWRSSVAATPTVTGTTRLSKPPPTPTSTSPAASSTGATVVVPDPEAHPACRLLHWADLPADVRPDRPSSHVTYEDRPDECRIDNSLIGVSAPPPGGTPSGGGGTVQFFMARATVSDKLSPIEQFTEPRAGAAIRKITIGGQPAVEMERSGDDPPACGVYVEPTAGPFMVVIQNDRFPRHAPCDLARTLAEAALQRHR